MPACGAGGGVGAGAVVSPGSELYEITDPSTMRLDASVASDDLASIAVGRPVDFEVRGYPGQRFTGTIARVAPAADPVTRQIQVLVDIPNPGGKLVAGLYAEGRIAVEKREGIVAPMSAIDSSGDQPSVLRVKNGVVERTVVALGVRDERGGIVEAPNGLAPGDTLRLGRAQKNLVPGSKVVVEGAAPAAVPDPAVAGSAAPAPVPQAKPAERSGSASGSGSAPGSGGAAGSSSGSAMGSGRGSAAGSAK